eukprot:EG_transcript_18823
MQRFGTADVAAGIPTHLAPQEYACMSWAEEMDRHDRAVGSSYPSQQQPYGQPHMIVWKSWLNQQFDILPSLAPMQITDRDLWLQHIIVTLLEDVEFNPNHGSVLIQRLYKTLENASWKGAVEWLLGARTLQGFMRARNDVFAIVTRPPSGKSRVHLVWHWAWERADAENRRLKDRQNAQVMRLLCWHLERQPRRRCTIKELEVVCQQSLPVAPMCGDLVRLVSRNYQHIFHYNSSSAEVSLRNVSPHF